MKESPEERQVKEVEMQLPQSNGRTRTEHVEATVNGRGLFQRTSTTNGPRQQEGRMRNQCLPCGISMKMMAGPLS